MSSRSKIQTIPLRSKPERTIKIRKRETTFNTEADIPVKQTQISTLRAKSTMRAKTSFETSRSTVQPTSRTTNTKGDLSSLNNQSMISLREELMKSHDFTETSIPDLHKLLSHLRVFSTECVLNRDYDQAEACDSLTNEIKEYLKHADASNRHNAGDNVKLQSQLAQFTDKLDEFDQQTVLRRSELEKRHESELCEFDHYWQTEAPRKYRKPSQKLLSLSENERRVGLQGDYKLARELKAKADHLRKIEAETAQQRLNTDYVAARDKLIDRQIQERNSFDKVRAEAREALAAKQEVNLRAAANREKVLAYKEHRALNSHRDRQTGEPSKASIASMLGRERSDLLLPKLVPPDYNAIRAGESARNREAARRSRETEERLKQKDEEKIKFYENYWKNQNKQENKEENPPQQPNEPEPQSLMSQIKSEIQNVQETIHNENENQNENQNQNENDKQKKAEESSGSYYSEEEDEKMNDGLVKPDDGPTGLVTQIKTAAEIDDEKKPTIVLGEDAENQKAEKAQHNEYYSDEEEEYYYSDEGAK